MKVFKHTKQAVNNLTKIELEYTSPKLLRARDLELAIPGRFEECLIEHFQELTNPILPLFVSVRSLHHWMSYPPSSTLASYPYEVLMATTTIFFSKVLLSPPISDLSQATKIFDKMNE